LVELRGGCRGSRQPEYFMSARNQLPHHGGADHACPTENENPHDLPHTWKRAHPMPRLPSQAFAADDIAMQRVGLNTE